jgi:hypothetical protein
MQQKVAIGLRSLQAYNSPKLCCHARFHTCFARQCQRQRRVDAGLQSQNLECFSVCIYNVHVSGTWALPSSGSAPVSLQLTGISPLCTGCASC